MATYLRYVQIYRGKNITNYKYTSAVFQREIIIMKNGVQLFNSALFLANETLSFRCCFPVIVLRQISDKSKKKYTLVSFLSGSVTLVPGHLCIHISIFSIKPIDTCSRFVQIKQLHNFRKLAPPAILNFQWVECHYVTEINNRYRN